MYVLGPISTLEGAFGFCLIICSLGDFCFLAPNDFSQFFEFLVFLVKILNLFLQLVRYNLTIPASWLHRLASLSRGSQKVCPEPPQQSDYKRGSSHGSKFSLELRG